MKLKQPVVVVSSIWRQILADTDKKVFNLPVDGTLGAAMLLAWV